MKLRESSSALLDASGNGTLSFRVPSWQRWRVTEVVVSTDQPAGSTPVPTSNTYLNGTDPAYLEGGTRDGDLDVGHGLIEADPGDVIYQVFSGGIPGSTAFTGIRGTKETTR